MGHVVMMKMLFATNQGAYCGSCFSLDREIQSLQYLHSYCAGLQQCKATCKVMLFFFQMINLCWTECPLKGH